MFFASTASVFLESESPGQNQPPSLSTEEIDNAAQTFLKLETLQTVHNPIPTDPLPVFKQAKKSLTSIPYERIGGLIDGER